LPQLRGILLITFILQLIGTAQVFLEAYLFASGGPVNPPTMILLLIFQYAFQSSDGGSNYGAATALSLMPVGFAPYDSVHPAGNRWSSADSLAAVRGERVQSRAGHAVL
jgi:hypothetical protein